MKLRKFIAFLTASIAVLFMFTACDGSEYKKALELMEHENYEDAAVIFSEISDYKDSSEMLKRCNYEIAVGYFNSQKYEQAIEMFNSLGDYKDSVVKINDCKKGMANNYFAAGEYEAAIPIFEEFGDYEAIKDCKWGMLIDYCTKNEVNRVLEHDSSKSTTTFTATPSKDGLIVNYSFATENSNHELNFVIEKENPNQVLVKIEGETAGFPERGVATVDLRTYKSGDSLNWNVKDFGTELSGIVTNYSERNTLRGITSLTKFNYNSDFDLAYSYFKKMLEGSGLGVTLEDLGIG